MFSYEIRRSCHSDEITRFTLGLNGLPHTLWAELVFDAQGAAGDGCIPKRCSWLKGISEEFILSMGWVCKNIQ